ncbi:DMT family transporter [Alkalihalobacillus pseudalcaliphilus]|uniref:DMT family transporter n=1 Tax=Alkalihalobacillus pseudalcaliphilus TaxID=79884 RepID=UPI00064DFE69|nr:multidrug efflux SMR transporter [Alkalihalobacillus pseudalcaliphilus]KMK78180.1 multidrug resistance protein SMR [Alkalihalobacillus pseudalcaliphilus]
MEWIYLVIAGIFEMAGVVMINQWHHSKKWTAMFLLIFFFGLSFLFLSLAMEVLPMGTAYAIWTGIGASGGALLGIFLYNEPKDKWRIFFISLILVSAVGLKAIS